MGSQFAPGLHIIRPANVPLIRIDGLQDFRVEGGWEFSTYYTLDNRKRTHGYISLELMVRSHVRDEMRRLMALSNAAREAFVGGVN